MNEPSQVYRQAQQVIECERFYQEHPDGMFGQDWGDPLGTPHLLPVTAYLVEALEMTAWSARPPVWLEIGCGGGRWSTVMAKMIQAIGFDIVTEDVTPFWYATDGSYVACTKTLDRLTRLNLPHPTFAVCPDGDLTQWKSLMSRGYLSTVFSFDVFIHFDDALINRYLGMITELIVPQGRVIVNFACRFPGHPKWEDGTQWVNYVLDWDELTKSPRGRLLDGLLSKYTLIRSIPCPRGYGSVCLVLERLYN